MRRVLLASVLLLLSVLGGCSIYRDPSFRAGAVTIGEMTDEAIELGFDLHLTNPNREPLQLVQFDYTVSADGRHAYRGRRSAEATLNAQDTRTIRIPAVIPYEQVGWAASGPPPSFRYQLAGSLLYLTPGELAETLLDIGLRRPTVRFRHAGEVARPAPGAVSPP